MSRPKLDHPGPGIPSGGRLAPDPGKSRRLLEQGIHPASMLPLLEDIGPPRCCGQCAQLWVREVQARRFTKCAAAAATNRSGPDVPPDMPACRAFTLDPSRA